MVNRSLRACLTGSFAVVWACSLNAAVCLAADVPPSETLLPTSTQLWVSAPQYPLTIKAWDQTQLGKLMEDPIMKPFRDDLPRQRRERRDPDDLAYDLTDDDVREIASGEACFALVHPKDRQPSRLVLIDVTGRAPQTQAVMKRLRDDLIKQGAAPSTQKVSDATLNLYSKNKVRLADFLHGNLYCAGRDDTVVRSVLERLLKPAENALSSFVPFQRVRHRVKADNALIKLDEKAVPHMLWFMQPIGYLEAQRILNPPDEAQPRSKKRPDYLTVAKKSGFEALQGAGGWSHFADAGYDQLHRLAVYAPKPWEKSMPMLSLANEGGLLATDDVWVPADLATHSTSQLELMKAFDHFGPFFNEAVAGGKKDAWNRSLRAWRDDSPRVDLKEEIVRRLIVETNGRELARCTVVTDNRQPIKKDSQRQLTAARIRASAEDYATLGNGPNGGPCGPKNATPEQQKHATEIAEHKVREAVRRFFKPDVENELAILHKNVLPGVDLWELLPEEEEEDEPASKKRKAPAIVVERGGKTTKVPAPEVVPAEHEAVCVTHGHFLHSSHYSLMRKVIEHIRAEGLPLGLDADYGSVMEGIDAELKRRAWPECAARRFSRTDEENLADYELAKAGLLRQSDTMLGRILSGGVGPATGDGRPLDYSKLPNYGAVRPYLKPSGLLIRSETEGEAKDLPDWCGWFLVNFTLQK
jgi:hypothetical protein